MSENNFTLDSFIDFYHNNKTNIIVTISVLLLLGLSFYVYTSYVKETEQELSQKINKIHISLLQLENVKEKSISHEDDLKSITDQLVSIYQGNSSFNNGIRAYYIVAAHELKMKNYESAKKKLLEIFNKNKKNYLAPMAVLLLANIYEEEADFSKNQ